MELHRYHVDEGKDYRVFAARMTAVLTAATTAVEDHETYKPANQTSGWYVGNRRVTPQDVHVHKSTCCAAS